MAEFRGTADLVLSAVVDAKNPPKSRRRFVRTDTHPVWTRPRWWSRSAFELGGTRPRPAAGPSAAAGSRVASDCAWPRGSPSAFPTGPFWTGKTDQSTLNSGRWPCDGCPFCSRLFLARWPGEREMGKKTKKNIYQWLNNTDLENAISNITRITHCTKCQCYIRGNFFLSLVTTKNI